jgi:hypothetical protein
VFISNGTKYPLMSPAFSGQEKQTEAEQDGDSSPASPRKSGVIRADVFLVSIQTGAES